MDNRIRDGLLVLLDEAYISEDYQNPWFKDNDPASSILPSLECLSAEQAARRPPIGRYPIAGHAAHLATSLEAFARAMRGGNWEIDWEASWSYTEPLDEGAWAALRIRLRTAYAEVRAIVAATDVPPEQIFYLATSLAHAAYHLGAIRQLGADVLPHE